VAAMSHPSYPNPTIREVICEIHFALEDGRDWNPSWYSEFFKQVEDNFPTFQPVSIPIILDAVRYLPASSAVLLPQLIRYQHKSGNILLHLAESRISVHVLPKYPGWRQVLEDIIYTWERIRKVVSPNMITRIGIRYLNGIERSSPDETLDKWLITNQYISSSVLQSKPRFELQSSINLDNGNRIQVIITDRPPAPNGYGTFIFDIDRVMEQTISVETNSLTEVVNKLHNDVWEVFHSARSSKLESLLKGELA
jgi:uncharacterized protein (TIGR04255 family)